MLLCGLQNQTYAMITYFYNIDQTRPLFAYFYPFLNTMPNIVQNGADGVPT